MKEIIPAILTDSVEDLQEKLRRVEGIVSEVQIDIMDGRFVKNVSVSLADLSVVSTSLRISVHLMVAHPQQYFSACDGAHAQHVIFHYEACTDPKATIREAKEYSFRRGVALNPETPIIALAPFADDLDSVLLLGVHPGHQGQQFIPATIEKVAALRSMLPHLIIGVDGGVGPDNVSSLAAAGADQLIVGSAIFSQPDAKNAIMQLRQRVKT